MLSNERVFKVFKYLKTVSQSFNQFQRIHLQLHYSGRAYIYQATNEKHSGEVPPASPLMSTPEPLSGAPPELQTCQRRREGVVLVPEVPPASRKGTVTQQSVGAFKLFLLLQPLLALFSTAKSRVMERSACQGGAGTADVTATAADRKRAPQRCSPINALPNTFHFTPNIIHLITLFSLLPPCLAFQEGKTRRRHSCPQGKSLCVKG